MLLSWHRCRDVHNIDPYLVSPPRAMGCGSPSPACNSVFAQLGGIAASIVERSENCLTTVTDGNGQILASWGSGAAGRRAAGSNLAPFFSWSESTIGTNGMGTALTQPRPMPVRGPEHWCQALHGWNCLGVAVYDSVTREAVAALNVSAWESPVPLSAHQLTREMRVVHDGLRQRAWRDAVEVADAFTEASRIAHGALLAVDAAGNVIAANEKVQAFLGRLPASFALDPAKRYRGNRSGLAEIARRSVQRVQAEPQWVGSADLGFLLGGSTQLFEVRPVLSTGGVIGLILSDEGAADGETISTDEAQASSHRRFRTGSWVCATAARCCCRRAKSGTRRHGVTMSGWLPTGGGCARPLMGWTTWCRSCPSSGSSRSTGVMSSTSPGSAKSNIMAKAP